MRRGGRARRATRRRPVCARGAQGPTDWLESLALSGLSWREIAGAASRASRVRTRSLNGAVPISPRGSGARGPGSLRRSGRRREERPRAVPDDEFHRHLDRNGDDALRTVDPAVRPDLLALLGPRQGELLGGDRHDLPAVLLLLGLVEVRLEREEAGDEEEEEDGSARDDRQGVGLSGLTHALFPPHAFSKWSDSSRRGSRTGTSGRFRSARAAAATKRPPIPASSATSTILGPAREALASGITIQ